ncbi:MAG: hypothetical protein IPK60_21550 [Sandaracinaceae bacterium]|nr:hypothetical protein [Sandaracinaceae bacterium]
MKTIVKALSEDDRLALVKLVDEQLSPMRTLGITIAGFSIAAMVMGFFKLREARLLHPGDNPFPISTVIAWGLGALLLVGAFIVWQRHRHAASHPLLQAMLERRGSATHIEIKRVPKRREEQLSIHSGDALPIVLLVSPEKRQSTMQLLKRIYPSIAKT